jgi:hypothetical protein
MEIKPKSVDKNHLIHEKCTMKIQYGQKKLTTYTFIFIKHICD